MRISNLIKELEQLKEKHGDLEVQFSCYDTYYMEHFEHDIYHLKVERVNDKDVILLK